MNGAMDRCDSSTEIDYYRYLYLLPFHLDDTTRRWIDLLCSVAIMSGAAGTVGSGRSQGTGSGR
eukprot:COSAG06_NODE_12348_length_1391_cov_20.763158_1_plen_64_part_00